MRRLALATAVWLAAIAAPAAADQAVLVGRFAFTPDNLAVAPGERVTWVWYSPLDTNHSVTSDPDQAEAWDSDPGSVPDDDDHPVGSAFSHRFTRPGTYGYYCKPHPFMRGTVTVTGAGEPPREAEPPPPSGEPGGGAAPGTPAEDARDATAPSVGRLRVRPARLCARRSRSCRATRARVGFTLSEPARVEGRLARGRTVRRFGARGRAGANAVGVSARGLAPGRYSLSLVAVDAAGNRSAPARTTVGVRR